MRHGLELGKDESVGAGRIAANLIFNNHRADAQHNNLLARCSQPPNYAPVRVPGGLEDGGVLWGRISRKGRPDRLSTRGGSLVLGKARRNERRAASPFIGPEDAGSHRGRSRDFTAPKGLNYLGVLGSARTQGDVWGTVCHGARGICNAVFPCLLYTSDAADE